VSLALQLLPQNELERVLAAVRKADQDEERENARIHKLMKQYQEQPSGQPYQLPQKPYPRILLNPEPGEDTDPPGWEGTLILKKKLEPTWWKKLLNRLKRLTQKANS